MFSPDFDLGSSKRALVLLVLDYEESMKLYHGAVRYSQGSLAMILWGFFTDNSTIRKKFIEGDRPFPRKKVGKGSWDGDR